MSCGLPSFGQVLVKRIKGGKFTLFSRTLQNKYTGANETMTLVFDEARQRFVNGSLKRVSKEFYDFSTEQFNPRSVWRQDIFGNQGYGYTGRVVSAADAKSHLIDHTRMTSNHFTDYCADDFKAFFGDAEYYCHSNKIPEGLPNPKEMENIAERAYEDITALPDYNRAYRAVERENHEIWLNRGW